MEVFRNWGEGEDWLQLAKHSHLCRNMKKVTCDILNTLLNLVLFYLYRGTDTELHCCGEGENLKMVSFQVFFPAVQTQLNRIIKIREIWGSLRVVLNKLLLCKTRAACFIFVPDASRQPGSCQGQVQEQLHGGCIPAPAKGIR